MIFINFATKKAQMDAHSRQFHTPYTGLSPDALGHTQVAGKPLVHVLKLCFSSKYSGQLRSPQKTSCYFISTHNLFRGPREELRMLCIVFLTADIPEVRRHGLLACRRVFLRIERSEVGGHLAQVFAARLHGSRHCAEAETCVDGVLGLRDVDLGRFAHVQAVALVARGGCCAVGTKQHFCARVLAALARLC